MAHGDGHGLDDDASGIVVNGMDGQPELGRDLLVGRALVEEP